MAGEITILSFDSARRVPFSLDGRILFSSPGYELVHLTLYPGEGMELHIQPFDVVFFVAEGTGTLIAGEQTIEIIANNTIFIKQGVSRAWRNNGTDKLRILVNKLLR